MGQNIDLLASSPNVTWSFEKTTPFATNGSCYRSRIYTTEVNLNPLVAAGDQLLSLAATIETIECPADCSKLLQDLAHEIRSFEHRAQIANYSSNIIVAARYALCCLLDEAILATPWGQENGWSEKNLLTLFHNENDGSVRFFSIINRSLEDIASNLHLIELLYLCLNFGFEGKYRKTQTGSHELLSIINKLYQIITQYNPRPHKNIFIHHESSPKSSPDHDTPNTAPIVGTQKLLWLASGLAFAISGLIYLGIILKLDNMSKPTYNTIKQLVKNNQRQT